MDFYCPHCNFTMDLAAWSEGSWCHSNSNMCTNMVHLWGLAAKYLGARGCLTCLHPLCLLLDPSIVHINHIIIMCTCPLCFDAFCLQNLQIVDTGAHIMGPNAHAQTHHIYKFEGVCFTAVIMSPGMCGREGHSQPPPPSGGPWPCRALENAPALPHAVVAGGGGVGAGRGGTDSVHKLTLLLGLMCHCRWEMRPGCDTNTLIMDWFLCCIHGGTQEAPMCKARVYGYTDIYTV